MSNTTILLTVFLFLGTLLAPFLQGKEEVKKASPPLKKKLKTPVQTPRKVAPAQKVQKQAAPAKKVQKKNPQKTKALPAKTAKKAAPRKKAPTFPVFLPAPRELLPLSARGEKPSSPVKISGNFDYYFYARRDQRLPVTFINHPTNDAPQPPVDLIIASPTRTLERKLIPHNNKLSYRIHARETGVYSFRIRVRSPHQVISLDSPVPGQAFAGTQKLSLYACSGTLYFAIPAGVKKVVLEAEALPGNESSLALLRQDGTIAAAKNHFRGKILLTGIRKNHARNEIWGIQFNASKLFLRLKAPIPQLFSTSPMNLLVKKGTQRKYPVIPERNFIKNKDIVYNGDLMLLDNVARHWKITTKKFPQHWFGNEAALYTAKDLRNHIDFTNLIWSRLALPYSGGKFKGEITLSGKGKVIAYLQTTPGKAPHKKRLPEFTFALTGKPKTFFFTFRTAPKETGYIFMKADEKSGTSARLSRLKITPIKEK